MSENQLDPVAEERFFRVEGDILFMEFLYPKTEDGDKIILLLLVSQDQITHAVCYEWNAHQALRQAHPLVTKKLLPFEDRLPTMLIPLTKTSSFMLITTTSMTIYKNKLDPQIQPNRYPLPVPDREPQRSPLWTRWARPLRNWLYNQKHDDIYLCREDGRVFYLGIGNEGEVENQAHLGRLCCDVDAAFDILDIGHEGGDLLLAAGNTGDGGLFVQKARDHPRCVQKFLNWTPVTDSVILKAPGASTGSIHGDRLFVCSASSFARGAVVELRHGIEAQIGYVISLEELSGTRDIWILPDNTNGGVFMLTSDPVSSTVLHLPANFGEEISAIDETDCGLDLNAQTLAAGYTELGVLIQVTDKTILLGATTETWSSSRFDLNPSQIVTVAAVHGQTSLICAVIRTQQEIHLHLKKITSNGAKLELSDIGQPVEIHCEPVCVSIEEFDLGALVFIGTGDGKLLVYRVGDSMTLLLEASIDVESDDDISKAVDSLAIVSQGRNRACAKSTLLCGLRSGFLVPFEITINPGCASSPLVMRQAAPQHLGHTSVKVQGRGTNALLTCSNGFWQVVCPREDETSDCTVQRIWITDQNNPAYHPKSIHSFATLNSADAEKNSLSGSLFCIADGQLIICTLYQNVRTIPRRINLPGSAHKLAYSQHLRSLIVAYTQTTFETDSDPIKRYTRPHIEFVDPDLQHPIDGTLEIEGAEEEKDKPWRPRGAAGEKISCILEWTPRKGDEEYHFIIIGTSRRTHPDRGRVIFLQASRDPSSPSRIECSVKYIHKFESPVYSIVPYGDFTLMVSTGHEIVSLEPKISPSRRARVARYTVLSPAVSMSAHEPYLYLSSSRESLLILKASEDKLLLHGYDRQKHDGLSHIHIGGEMKLTLTSSRGGRVSLLTENGVTENDKMMPTALCEAHLPSSVMKLSSSSKMSPLSPGSQVFYGTAMNGTVYRFLTLGEKEWRLLRLLQNLCIRDPIICPFTPKRKRQRNPIGHEPHEFQPSQMHIDGDILARLVTRGSSYLMHMLVAEEFYNPSNVENGSAQATFERFTSLAQDVLGEPTSPVEGVMRWLKNAFHVEF
ncbi:hypothetical protein P175DRAFT_0501214 [Aspergillus ochraceoroseus IBT 24754]|nr:uncharacterized protein P175DRAFT_0501214 [Aspergillus ochraceoroseus IBT 24754]PTU20593.1 hypothetical protein P175DRAFT_0501214 [Aspergillus ochraceoroseus IBT 24754]